MLSPSICALTSGYALSARQAAFAKNGMNESFTPCSFSTRSCSRSRSAFTDVMSISLNVVRCAVMCCDCSRFSAMRLRRVVIFSRVSREPPDRCGRGGGAGAGAGAADGRAAGAAGAARPPPVRHAAPLAAASSTSGLLTTPPRPGALTAGEVARCDSRGEALRRAATAPHVGRCGAPRPGRGAGAAAAALRRCGCRAAQRRAGAAPRRRRRRRRGRRRLRRSRPALPDGDHVALVP